MASSDISILGTIVFDIFVKNYSYLPKNGEAVELNVLPFAAGGCGLNSAVALSFLGADVSLFGSIGNDFFAKFIIDYLKTFSIDISSVKTSKRFPTSTSILLINKKGERSYFHFPGSSKEVSVHDKDLSKILNSKIFHVGGITLFPASIISSLSKIFNNVRSNNVVTSIDLAWDVENKWMKRIKPILPHTDILMGNEQEIRALTKENKLVKAVKLIHLMGVKNVIVKRGEKGSLVSKDFLLEEIPTIKVKSFDSTGAGDMFAGGFLYGILKGFSPIDSAKIGNVMGAIATTEFGSTTALRRIKSKNEVRKLLIKYYDFNYYI